MTTKSTARRRPAVQPAYLGILGAAVYLDGDHKTIRRLIASKRLAAWRLGNRIIKIKVADLDAVLTPMQGSRGQLAWITALLPQRSPRPPDDRVSYPFWS
jgi:excisionase family DNA binding protein